MNILRLINDTFIRTHAHLPEEDTFLSPGPCCLFQETWLSHKFQEGRDSSWDRPDGLTRS